jgi:hypothetical protein
MADAASTPAAVPTDIGSRHCLFTWANIAGTATCAAVEIPWYADRTIQVVAASYGSATLVIQGSLDNTNWVTLADPQGNALSFTSGAKMEVILENTRYIRPLTTGGTNTDLTIILYALRKNA